jgi:hypothetical protein
MKNRKFEGAWNDRVAQERPPARTIAKFPWQVPPLDSVQPEADPVDLNRSDLDKIKDQLLDSSGTGTEKVTVPEKVPVTGTEKEPVTGTEKVTVTKKAPVTEKAAATFRIPHQELDQLFRDLDSGEFKLYLKLYRLSYGWQKETCSVGIANLMESLSMSKNAIRQAKEGLITKGLLEIVRTVNLGPNGFTEYRVIRKGGTGTEKVTVPEKVTVTKKGPIKEDHDHDHDLNHDHEINHQKQVMTIYQSVTGNDWKEVDKETYEKIKNVKLEIIEQALKITQARATQRPGSLAYFVKEILSQANPLPATRTQRKRILAGIIEQVRTANAGRNGYPISEFAEDVKQACVREGVIFDPPLFNEIIS